MPEWQRRASVLVHGVLYGLLLVTPLSGWIYSSSTGVQVVYLGLIPLPDLVPKDRQLARVLLALHLTLNFTLFSLVCVHTAAALKHHFIDRDTVLTRMLPLWRSAIQGKGQG
jgi:cytochrome b561